MESLSVAVLMLSGIIIGNPHGEFIVGVQGGGAAINESVAQSSTSTSTSSGGNFPTTILNEHYDDPGSSRAVGLFGQYRNTFDNNWMLGIHFGYTDESAAWGRHLDTTSTSMTQTSVGDRNYEFEADDVYDVLAMVGYQMEKVNPFVLFGLSDMRVEHEYTEEQRYEYQDPAIDNTSMSTRKGKNTLSGWKLAVGAEYPLSEKIIGYALIHYADYGRFASFAGRAFDLSQTGIRIGIGYKF